MPTISRVPPWCVWILLALLGVLGLVHLGADFPHYSRWMDDSARYTDEGWYASGALNHTLTGHWLRPGDFNPMVTIPVWSLVLGFVFHFTGISLALARGVAVLFTFGTVLAGGALMRRSHPRLAPLFMLLLAASPLLFFFSRSALVEPALIFFLVASAWAASAAERRPFVGALLCGLLFVLAILTKSSALFVAPALLYLLWFPQRKNRQRALQSIAVAALVFALGYGAYWLLVIRTHPDDFRTLYNENVPYLGLKSIEKSVRVIYRSVVWLDPILFPVAALAVVASIKRFRGLWLDPLFVFAVLFYCGYSGFLVLHVDAGPHYFAVMVFPVMLLALLMLQTLEREMPAAGKAVGALMLLAVAMNVAYIGWMMRRSQYTLRDACLQIRQQIDADPRATRLVIGRGAMQTTFLTHIPALDELGVESVADKMKLEHPGWVVTWKDTLTIMQGPEVAEHYRFVLKGQYPVFDQLDQRGGLLLYRVEPK